MECKEYVEFTVDSPHGDYKAGRFGIIVGFCRGGDDVPCAIVRKTVKAVLKENSYLDWAEQEGEQLSLDELETDFEVDAERYFGWDYRAPEQLSPRERQQYREDLVDVMEAIETIGGNVSNFIEKYFSLKENELQQRKQLLYKFYQNTYGKLRQG